MKRYMQNHDANLHPKTRASFRLYRVGFISSLLTADGLFPVNWKAITASTKITLLLDPKRTPALIIKLRLILVVHTDDLGSNITSKQHGRCSFRT